ncbi:NAD(P)-dependent glycerol-1-phosphate dehydrogenase [Candidatus Micrarchaeota archaeon CG_4_10_14_0_2_um_filter_60_11]|nr:MAG: hypothetical protein AUJ16_03335 [Candidatus Micrarchaeota archaeon CG1_02_60_51]PIN95801.1 MAG: NAD(P)-dependent glycerol-1-phosphate dehydrogenase [Candidatus Micrarchaeota archaeon CG10_big_fil_rev_8_21_14_0_10_60_32]PIO01760.1 MAG: NAD(P)-dependent glycerol-1-phosphate dehydrogenase [Candidatus Micrarchaeota archaeon CG09_land_8_20_14_0_10_60_16]PIY91123.1 MAG: NAD(P)-dependent glycerol-1-phosphate dehydrogenase [Candidatus Micrarchaeota archaeon CG_4_10_14_0_8_um_filter_60_7]PIZ907
MIHKISLPRRIVKGEGCIVEAAAVMRELEFEKALVLFDEGTRGIAGDGVALATKGDSVLVGAATVREVERIAALAKQAHEVFIGVGGGSVIDLAKAASFKAGKPFFSIPTAPSHDGIASSRASLSDGRTRMSIAAEPPTAVICDITIMAKCPERMYAAGCGDAISNITAVRDWQIAREAGEYYGGYAAALSLLSAETVMANAERMAKDRVFGTDLLCESLISSGIAMAIAGSSRPASGAEHLFSHALDELRGKPALHGEQVGVGAIMTAKLQGQDWERIRDALKLLGAPTTAKGLGVASADIAEALVAATKVRKQVTILGNGLTRSQAEALARATGVI